MIRRPPRSTQSRSSAASDVYKRQVLSTSGPAAPLGQPEQRSLMLFEEQINVKGGIDGVKVKFIIEDDESDPAKAAVAINKLIKQENVLAVICLLYTSDAADDLLCVYLC